MAKVYILLAAFFWTACGPSLEDSIEKLGSERPDERQQAQHRLLLAQEQAVDPLLEALDDPRYAVGRAELADVLVSLMLRVEDERIAKALQRHLLDDPDQRVRALITYKLGGHKNPEFAETFFQAVEDTSDRVRQEAMSALGLLETKFSEAQKERARAIARRLLDDESREVRIEAMIVVEDYVALLANQARQQALKADLEGAEALFAQALAFSPRSLRANYFLGRHYMEHGQLERGMQLLREIGLLLDVPLLEEAPQIDGRLDDRAWEQAIALDIPYEASKHSAAIVSEVRSRGYVGYTRDALYLGTICYDAHPESLVVGSREYDSNISFQDLVQLYLYADFEPHSFVFISINSAGAVTDAWHKHIRDRDVSWATDGEGAAYVGEDFWSVEYKLKLGTTPEFPRPRPGDRWRFNMQRNFRGQQFIKWAPNYYDRSYPDCMGILLFK